MTGGKDSCVAKTVCLISEICVLCVHGSMSAGSVIPLYNPAIGATSLASLFFPFQTSFSRGFTKNMKLEAVNPRNPGELCVASVVSVKGRLMWLHLEGMFLRTQGTSGDGKECTRISTHTSPFLVFKKLLNYSVFLNKRN